jgi:hypothetical protein
MSPIKQLPRSVVRAYIGAARLPLNAVARARGQQDNEQWPPALAFEGLEAGVETVVGSLLRDDDLVEAGRLRQAKVAQLRKAAQLETLAEATREQASEQFSERREQAEQKRRAAQLRADQRERQIEQDATRAKAQVEQKAAKKTSAARAAKAAQEQVIERRERAATADALAKEANALQTQQEALEAAETVDVIDETLEGTKEARRSS